MFQRDPNKEVEALSDELSHSTHLFEEKGKHLVESLHADFAEIDRELLNMENLLREANDAAEETLQNDEA